MLIAQTDAEELPSVTVNPYFSFGSCYQNRLWDETTSKWVQQWRAGQGGKDR